VERQRAVVELAEGVLELLRAVVEIPARRRWNWAYNWGNSSSLVSVVIIFVS
jgi:hypothetical protein